ncbi:MAG: binding protein [Oscillospiraceae bacterium]|nr:binding protein [Oscillospiraceae bacterium]
MEFGVGSILEGKVTGITNFGAFVSLPEGRSGLVHISEIAFSYVNSVKDHLAEGQEVKVKVIGIDDQGRINLSIKKAAEQPHRQDNGGFRPSGNASRPAGAPRQGGGAPRQGGVRSGGGMSRPMENKEPQDFEDRLKKFMAASDSKLSDLHFVDKRNSRRGKK